VLSEAKKSRGPNLNVRRRLKAGSEGGSIGKETPSEPTPAPSLTEGLIRAGEKHGLAALVANAYAIGEEVTLKAPDGRLKTIIVTNPKYLRHIKAGDEVVITRDQALALSPAKESL
jgi:hypothetical protein